MEAITAFLLRSRTYLSFLRKLNVANNMCECRNPIFIIQSIETRIEKVNED
jgi:hypothetical protein